MGFRKLLELKEELRDLWKSEKLSTPVAFGIHWVWVLVFRKQFCDCTSVILNHLNTRNLSLRTLAPSRKNGVSFETNVLNIFLPSGVLEKVLIKFKIYIDPNTYRVSGFDCAFQRGGREGWVYCRVEYSRNYLLGRLKAKAVPWGDWGLAPISGSKTVSVCHHSATCSTQVTYNTHVPTL